MHGIRYLVLLLCLVFALTAFVACNNEKTPAGTTEGENTTDPVTDAPTSMVIDVSQYALYIPENAPKNVTGAGTALVVAVQESLGAEFGAFGGDFVANEADIDPNAFEILVGATNRPESTQALEELGTTTGFVIKKIGNKIVINSNAPSLVDEAVQYFIQTYVSKGANGSFEIPVELLHVDQSSTGVSLLDTNNQLQLSVIFSQLLDTEDKDGNISDNTQDRVDYVVTYFLELNKQFMKDFSQHQIAFEDDKSAADSDKYEILLGRTNRPETNVFLSTLKVNEYGYGVVGNKIVVAGWSDKTIGMAVDLFMADLEKYVVDSDGLKNFVMTENDKTVGVYDTWNVDLPLYTAGKLDGAAQLLNNNYQAYYIETNPEEFQAYCDSLAALGYRLHQKNQIGDNLYATYYDAKYMLHTYYVAYNNTVRVIVEKMDKVILPQNEDKGWKKITETTFTMMGLDDAAGNFGNCFIITLEDGSFILHDGGGDKGTFAGADRDELWSLLNRLNVREDGKIVIAAWIISHQHWDHFKNGYDMIKMYYKKGITVEKIIYNVPAETTRFNSYNPGNYYENGNINDLTLWMGTKQVIMHTGQTIQIRNLKLEVMYTVDDVYPDSIVKFNNSSFVHRFDVGEGANKQRMIIVGDIEEVASMRLVQMYGDELKCDIMQVAHHGYGGSVELYARFKPDIVLWPKDKNAVNNQLSGSGYYPGINQSLINQKNVKLVVIADDGHKTISLPVVGLTDNRTTNQNNLVTVWPREDGLP